MKDLKTLKRMFLQILDILNKKQRLQMAGVLTVIVLGSVLELLGVSSILPFIEAIVSPETLLNNSIVQSVLGVFGPIDARKLIIYIGIGIVLLYLTKNVFLSFSSYLQSKFNNYIRCELSSLMLSSYMNRPYESFSTSGSDVILRGVVEDIDGVYAVMTNGFKFAAESLVIILISVYLVITDFYLAMGVLFMGILCMLFLVLGLKRKISKLGIVERNALGVLKKWIVQGVGGIKDAMVFDRRDFFLNNYHDAYLVYSGANAKFTFVSALPERIIEAFCISGIIITVLIRYLMGVDVSTFVPKLSIFAMGAFRLLPSISRTTGNVNTFIFYRPTVEAAHENITGARKYISNQKDVSIEEDLGKNICFRDRVEIKNLVWKYEGTETPIINNLNLSIKKGDVIGIIGESGSGKSTLADIILRLYKPQQGGVFMDGIDISTIPHSWSRILGYVPQAVFLLDDTIRENIIFGDDNRDDAKVWEALEKASLAAFVKSLPEGIDTVVGERGIKFSGGQRQRIAIARALYLEPEIMILDEATAALDNETEAAVMESIDALAGTMTLIIIAHRVTTLRNCNVIYEVKEGKTVERVKDDVIVV